MKPIQQILFIVSILTLSLQLMGCAEDGEDGSAALDCGEYGSEHDGHCHCDDGFAFNGETCVGLEEITNLCEEEAHTESDTEVDTDVGTDEHDEDTDEHDEDTEEHDHDEEMGACLCETVSECHCDGEVIEYGGNAYCILELH